MASIRISELRPAGSELFQDSESFLTELSESRELYQVLGGVRRVNTVNSDVNSVAINSRIRSRVNISGINFN
jgi:hypothetical protein